MDDLYTLGVLIAFAISLIKVIINCSALMSIRASNFKKVGLNYKCSTGTFSEEPNSTIGFVFYLIYALAIAPIFSWLSVITSVGFYIAHMTSKADMPERMKELHFRLANVNLSKDEVLQISREINTILGKKTLFEKDDVDLPSGNLLEEDFQLILESGEWHSDLEISPANKIVKFYSRTPDYDSIFHSKYEYKIENGRVMIRCLEDYTDHYGTHEYIIKDNTVLESDIRKNHKEGRFEFFSLEEKLTKYSREVSWHELTDFKIRFFIMSKHPELLPSIEIRKLARTELERLRAGVASAIGEVKALGLIVIEDNPERLDYKLPENCDPSLEEKVRHCFSKESLQKFKISETELNNFKKYESDLMHFLGDKKAA